MNRFGVVAGHRVGRFASSPAELREVLGDPGKVDVPPAYLPAGADGLTPDGVRAAAGLALAVGDTNTADSLFHLAAVSTTIAGPRHQEESAVAAALAAAARLAFDYKAIIPR